MSVEYKNPSSLPVPIGPYSHLAKVTGDEMVFFAGMAPVDGNGKPMSPDDFDAQVRAVWNAMEAGLRSEGLGLGNIVQMTTYLVRTLDIEPYYAIRKVLFKDYYPDGMFPPNTLLVIERLVLPELLIEVQFTAAR